MPLSVIVDISDPAVRTINGTEVISKPEWWNGTGSRLLEAFEAPDQPSLEYQYHGQWMSLAGRGRQNYNLRIEFESAGRVISTSHGEQPEPDHTPDKVNGIMMAWPAFSQDDAEKGRVMSLYAQQGDIVLDYLLFQPSSSWTVAGETLVMDDQDGWMEYSGLWNASWGLAVPPTTPLPFEDVGEAMNLTVSQTRTKGASFKTSFVGTNIAAYGITQQVPGNLSISYVLDDNAPETVTLFDGTQQVNRTHWEVNRQFFSRSLEGNETDIHTIQVTVDEISGNQTFYFDFLTFQGTQYTNVASPGTPLASPLPKLQWPQPIKSSSKSLAIGLGVGLPLAALVVGGGLFWMWKKKRGKKV